MPEIGPAPVLTLVVGAFDACVYMLIRGAVGVRMLFVFVAAVLGMERPHTRSGSAQDSASRWASGDTSAPSTPLRTS